MIVDYLLVIIALIWLTFATIHDIKKREVPDWLNYSLIIIALGLRLIHSIISKEFLFFVYGLLGFIVFLVLANILYFTKQWGGGDSKLLMGLGIIFVTYPSSLLRFFNPNLDFPFLLIIIINIFIAGAIYGLIWSFVLALKNKKRVSEELKKYKPLNINTLIIAVVISIGAFFLFKNLEIILIVSLILLVFILTYLTFFIKSVEKVSMIKNISIKKLTEGDWIVNPVYVNKKLICSPKDPGINKEQISLLKKYKIKSVVVREGIPFVPSFLVGIIISLVFGNIITIIFI